MDNNLITLFQLPVSNEQGNNCKNFSRSAMRGVVFL